MRIAAAAAGGGWSFVPNPVVNQDQPGTPNAAPEAVLSWLSELK